jgi:hypothetical protein
MLTATVIDRYGSRIAVEDDDETPGGASIRLAVVRGRP